jgi:serine acetyltransferase
MKSGLRSIRNFFFDEAELQLLFRDLERRFSKEAFESYGWIAKLKYLNYNVQYKTLVFYRLACACKASLLRRWFFANYQRLSMKTGIEFLTPKIGGGLIMPHWGRIILNAKRIGDDLYVFHNVTVGNDYVSGVPTIGNNVFIGTNSVILGDITVGDNVVIGAGSFVNSDIPSNSLAAGNPARVIRPIEDNFISNMIGY